MDRRDKIIAEGAFLRLRVKGSWEFCERTVGSAVVAIVAVTPDRELLLVEQFRPPLNANVIELPAGLVGDDGDSEETREKAAARELEEETGYRPKRLVFLTEGPTSAGMAAEQVAFYRAYDLTRIGPGGGADNEGITVHLVPLNDADEWLRARTAVGVLIDPKIYAALYFISHPPR